jgi:hypothetical protein
VADQPIGLQFEFHYRLTRETGRDGTYRKPSCSSKSSVGSNALGAGQCDRDGEGLAPVALQLAYALGLDDLLWSATSRSSLVDPFGSCLRPRWGGGCANATTLYTEIKAHSTAASGLRRTLRRLDARTPRVGEIECVRSQSGHVPSPSSLIKAFLERPRSA